MAPPAYDGPAPPDEGDARPAASLGQVSWVTVTPTRAGSDAGPGPLQSRIFGSGDHVHGALDQCHGCQQHFVVSRNTAPLNNHG